MNSELILTVGISGSGKSTWSKKFAQDNGIQRLSSDELRAVFGTGEEDQTVSGKVFAHMKSEVRKALSKGEKIIVDATNYSIKNRKDFIAIAKELKADITAYCFQVSIATAKKRNSERVRRVPEFVIDNQFKGLVWPKGDEVDKAFLVMEDGKVFSTIGAN